MVDWILALIRQNEILAYVIIAIVCFGESLAFISLLLPGIAVMIAAGALVPSGALSLWPLLRWLVENVHAKGSLATTDEVMEQATGSPLDDRAFRAHLHARYIDDAG